MNVSQDHLVQISIALTIASSLPSCVVGILNPKLKYFKLALFNISMSFFFFSYHVHEKTILIPLGVLILSIRYFGIYYKDFVTFSCFTLFPLMKEDGLAL